ncbi:adenylate/guanylate cyclase domain-containing protein [Actinospongicola halichondriae]|uniref:adenylate/guanylate cyclase domain-containing protein n=1 Tax=Actinospongicola halichondriae TaxID=3236844 RepID=UPI003D4855F0
MSENEGPGSLPDIPARRASDDDRQRVVTRLRDAAGEGIIDLDELEERVGAVYQARTLPELADLTVDLPAPTAVPPSAASSPDRQPFPALRDSGFQAHLSVYVSTMALLVVIWALTDFGGFFWPAIVGAAWGTGLAPHFMAANRQPSERAESRDRLDRRRSQELRRAERHAEHALRRAARHGVPPAPPVPPVPPTPATSGRSSGPGTADVADGDRARRTRFVVAMFVDVVGSTGLNEAIGDDGWVRVRDRVRTVLGECFEREGGWEVNTAGDGVLAQFDAPSRAVRAAIEINRRLARQRDETGFAPSVRIGVHSGDVVDDGADLIGSVINLASRVTAAAEPEQIMVTEHVADHLEQSFVTEDRGIHSLKGVSRPRHLLTVRWE